MRYIAVLDPDKHIHSVYFSIITSLENPDLFVYFFDNPSEFLSSARSISYDLLLMDIIFETGSGLYVLDYLRADLPVIISTEYFHYQKLLSTIPNIRFITRKTKDHTNLSRILRSLLCQTTPEQYFTFDESFFFPSPTSSISNDSFLYSLTKIRFITHEKNNLYTIHFIDNSCEHIRSLPFYAVCSSLKEQSISTLRPISSGTLINILLISRVCRHKNGRWQIFLSGMESIPFTVSPKYLDEIKEFIGE